MSSANPYARQATFLGHPLGLYVLFFTEMWERFSYYGMRALLMLYMVNYFKWSQSDSSGVYKWYTSLVYLTPLLGGFLADRYLGNTKAVVIGAVLMAVGQFLMMSDNVNIFYAALVFLIFGNGFFKPNMSTQVGRLYPPNDKRRDGAYTIFYMGINLGAFLSPLLCGWLQQNYDFKWGFACAGVGMVLGLVIYLVGLPLVRELPQTADATPAAVPDVGPTPRPGEPGTEHVRARTESPLTPGGAVQGTVTPADLADRPGTDILLPAAPLSEAQAARTPSVFGPLNTFAPHLFVALGVGLVVAAPVLYFLKLVSLGNTIGLGIAAICALISAWVVAQSDRALRDRVLVIYVLGFFVVFFWAAFEQAGNALNVWADQTTDRYLTTPGLPPDVPPADPEPKVSQKVGFLDFAFLNPVPAPWFQSINALAIFVLAPLFAWLWVKIDLSVPFKMVLGLLFMASSFFLMIEAARRENGATSIALAAAALPDRVERRDDGTLRPADEHHHERHPYHAGRLTYDPAAGRLNLTGVLTNPERERIVADTAPKGFTGLLSVVRGAAGKAGPDAKAVTVDLTGDPPVADLAACFPDSGASYDPGLKKLSLKEAKLPLKVKLPEVPDGFDLKQAGFKDDDVPATFDADTGVLTVRRELADRDVKGLLIAAGAPTFRGAVNQLHITSAQFRVSSWWLFWFYILATLGELCLSPVGLSMVSKLAPAKFATMLMGLWLLTSFFGGFAAGALGENYDKFAPTEFFLIIGGALTAAAVVLLLIVWKVRQMMHGVK